MALAQELEEQQGHLEQQRQSELATITQLEGQQADTAQQKQQATAAPLASATAAAEDLSKTADQPLPPSEAAGLSYKPHKADAKDIQGLSWALLGMALMGGVASKGNWLGASSVMNGAMKGFIKGDQAAAQKEWEDFETKFQTAEKHDQEALNRLKTVRDNKNLSLNAKMQQYQLIAAQYDMQDVATGAKLKSHDAVLKQIDARDNAITQARTRLESVKDKIDQQNAANVPGPADEGVVGMVKSGMPLSQAIPGYGKPAAAERKAARTAAIQSIQKETGMSADEAGKELARRTVEFSAGKASTTQLTKMLGATRQALSQLDFNVDQVTKEMKKLKSTDVSPVINAIIRQEEKWTGDPAYAGLFYFMNAAATESARLLSGGQASAAQLHQGAADEARQWANVNLTPASWAEVAASMKAEGRNKVQTYQDAISASEGKGQPDAVDWDKL
jgi:hypothetical protein